MARAPARKAPAKKPAPRKAAPKKASATAMERAGYIGGGETTVSVRQIENGYIVRESGMRRGKFFENETFTRKKPKVVF